MSEQGNDPALIPLPSLSYPNQILAQLCMTSSCPQRALSFHTHQSTQDHSRDLQVFIVLIGVNLPLRPVRYLPCTLSLMSHLASLSCLKGKEAGCWPLVDSFLAYPVDLPRTLQHTGMGTPGPSAGQAHRDVDLYTITVPSGFAYT